MINTRVIGAMDANSQKKYGRKHEECPRSGFIILQDIKSTMATVCKTTCKTWSCVSCRNAVKNRVAQTAEIGLKKFSTETQSYFITLTLRMVNKKIHGADTVNRVWRRWLERLRREFPRLWKQMAWLKVIEVTRKGMPHLHLLANFGVSWGEVHRDTICQDKARKYEGKVKLKWMKKGCSPEYGGECLTHLITRLWMHVTTPLDPIGEGSWETDVTEVTDPAKGAGYITKYLVKDMWGEKLKALGFGRRWSKNRKWPHVEKLQMRGSKEGRWYGKPRIYENWRSDGYHIINRKKWSIQKLGEMADLDSENSYLAEMVGDPMVLERYEKQRKWAIRKRLEELGANYS